MNIENVKAKSTIRQWFRRVMSENDWTAAEWARRGGTSPTNITRFLNGTAKSIPSSVTISKLAKAAGYGPVYLDWNTETLEKTVLIPVLPEEKVTEFLDERLDLDSLTTCIFAVDMRHKTTNMIAVTLTASSYDAEGIFAGDTVVCVSVKEQPFINGSRVVAKTEEGGIGVYGYNPPFLTTQSLSGLGPVKLSNAELIGTAVKVQRDL